MEQSVNDLTAIRRFTVGTNGEWTPANQTFPIESSEGQIIGAFLIVEGPAWACFISGRGYYESLWLDTDTPPYISPIRSEDGSVQKLVVSRKKLNDESKLIKLGDDKDE
jgi:hypothetical protein